MVNPKLKKTKTAAQPKQRVPKSLTVTVSKTVQIKQYEPSTVTLTEVHELADGDDARLVRREVYSNLSKSVLAMINHEIEIHGNTED